MKFRVTPLFHTDHEKMVWTVQAKQDNNPAKKWMWCLENEEMYIVSTRAEAKQKCVELRAKALEMGK